MLWPLASVAVLAVLTLGLAQSSRPAPVPDDPYETRVSAPDASALSAELTRRFTPATSTIYLASGADFADAIAGIPLVADAPLFLTTPEGDFDIPPGLFRAADVRRAVVLGGEAVVSAAAVASIRSRYADALVERIAGDDRYQTAALIAERAGPADTVFVVSGRDYPDALSAGAAAAETGAVVLLTEPDRLPGATTGALEGAGARTAYVIGGEDVVGPAVLQQLEAMRITTRRISGADRFSTANAVAEQFFDGAHRALLAPGDSFQAPIVASAAAARTGSPLLLRPAACTPEAVRRYVADHDITSVVNVAIDDGGAGVGLDDRC